MTVYLFLGPKRLQFLFQTFIFSKPPKLPHALKLSSFSALVINGPWFKSCSVRKLKLEAGCLRDIFLICKVGCWKAKKRKLFFGVSLNVQGYPLVRLVAQDRMHRRLRAYAGKGSGIQDYTRKGSGLLTPGFWGGCGWDESPSKTRQNPPTHHLECKMHEQ